MCLAFRSLKFSCFQVYERIKAPMLTLVSSGSPEQSYAVLSHLHLLVMRAPFIFASDYKHFYCQYNEPSYVKKLKLEMLTAVANESNTYEIGKQTGYLFKLSGFFRKKLAWMCFLFFNYDDFMFCLCQFQ